eukprot:TRINITY_DN31424_c0_g1_i1.p1 TRINITY_DN31424_c0_g1~~TRINITY_DN31424_c0_g1_i1.p1  ORF type:complete len:237 (+),score=55.50 TRINITY_DN31424_c0_g1_i1:45-755(+)
MGGGSSRREKDTADTADQEEQVRQLFIKSDLDGSGHLSRREFVRIARVLVPGVSDKQLKQLFNQVDTDNSRFIDVDELLNWVFSDHKVRLNVADALDADKVEDKDTDEIIRELKETHARKSQQSKQLHMEQTAMSKDKRKSERQVGEEAFREELTVFLQSREGDDMSHCEAMLEKGESLGVSAVALEPLQNRMEFILDRVASKEARHKRVKQRERHRAEAQAEARRKRFVDEELGR